MSKARDRLNRSWYVWRMMQHKPQISTEAKTKALLEFENSVVNYAQEILASRQEEGGFYDKVY